MSLYALDLTFTEQNFYKTKNHNLYATFNQFLNPEAMSVVGLSDCGIGWAEWEMHRQEPFDNVTEISASISRGKISTWKRYGSLQELKDEIAHLTGETEKYSRDSLPKSRDIYLDDYDWLTESR